MNPDIPSRGYIHGLLDRGNQVCLTPTEWNVLVPAIRNGEVGELDTDEGS